MIVEGSLPNERLRQTRLLKGWTQSQLAEAVGTNNETVSRWERGITLPSLYYRAKLCHVLGKTADELGLLTERSGPQSASSFPGVFLASAYADAEKEIVAALKVELQEYGITLWSGRAVLRQGLEDPRKVLHEAIRGAQIVLVIASPSAPCSRHVQKAL